MIRGIIFDKDGTLFDFAETWGAWAQNMLLAEAGGDRGLAQQLGQAIGFDLDSAAFHPDSPVIAGTADTVAQLMVPLLPAHRRAGLTARLDLMAQDVPLAPVTDLRALMAELRAAGYALGVVTNDAEAPARTHLAAFDLIDSFDFIAGYDSGHGAKPGAGPCLAFAQSVGVQADQCVMVGDSLTDLGAAQAAGMVGIGVLTGPALRHELTPMAQDVLDSIVDLPEWLAGYSPKQSAN